jgi:polyhydroxyalkanoate synthase subunit PhaC
MTASPPPSSLLHPIAIPEQLYREMARIYAASRNGSRLMTGRIQPGVGQTPGELIWTLNKSKLYHYYPQVPAERVHPVPLLLVFALINKPYIFDLRPGNSFIEFMTRQGYHVYLLDWGTFGPEDAHLDFADFALNYLPRAVRKVQAHSGAHALSMLGWCIGATLATIYAAMRPADGLRNLLLLTAPLDFADTGAGSFTLWLDERYFNVDALVAHMGVIPGEMIDWGNKLLKPVENFIGSYVRLWDNLDDPRIVASWQAMNTWINDPVPFPGAAFRQWIVDFFRENRLMRGELVMQGRVVDPANITAALLNIVADKDHLVPSCQSTSIMEHIASQDKELLIMPGGHIGIMAGSSAQKRLWPRIDAWLAARSDN